MEKELRELEDFLLKYDIKSPDISEGGIDWHLDHTLKVIVGVCSALKKSDPSMYRWGFSYARLYVLTLGYIPRGRGRAPAGSHSPDNLSLKTVKSLLAKSKKSLEEITLLPSKAFFAHPMFGMMKLKATQRFLRIHTRHHLKIMREIVR